MRDCQNSRINANHQDEVLLSLMNMYVMTSVLKANRVLGLIKKSFKQKILILFTLYKSQVFPGGLDYRAKLCKLGLLSLNADRISYKPIFLYKMLNGLTCPS